MYNTHLVVHFLSNVNGNVMLKSGNTVFVLPEQDCKLLGAADTSVANDASNSLGEIAQSMEEITQRLDTLRLALRGSSPAEGTKAPPPRQSQPQRPAEARQSQPQRPEPEPERRVPPFLVNESSKQTDWHEEAKRMNEIYLRQPKMRNKVVRRIAGMVRSDMLEIKGHLDVELRRKIANYLMNRDSLRTSVVPPDIAAFVDDRPLSETLGSRQWDPGSDQVKNTPSSNWHKSNEVQEEIMQKAGDDGFDFMYPKTEDVNFDSTSTSAMDTFGGE